MKLANLTMHDQSALVSKFASLGYEVNPTPLLREVSGTEDAIAAAHEAISAARAQGAEGVLLGGRTDVCIYAATFAAFHGLHICVAETERVRDENDRFVFKLSGVTPLNVYWDYDGGNASGLKVDTDLPWQK